MKHQKKSKTKRKSISLGTGAAQKAKKKIMTRKQRMDAAIKASGG